MDSLKTFIIYSHEDLKYRKGLEKYLNHLVRLKKINLWSDKEIKPGEVWNEVIQKNLDEAELILMLISVDFYNSEYIHNIELERARIRRERGDAILVPIIVRTCPSSYDLIQDFQALPSNLKPIDHWDIIDDAYSHVADEIEVLIENMARQKREIEVEKNIKIRLQAEKETKKAIELAEQRKKEQEAAIVAKQKAEQEKTEQVTQRKKADEMRQKAEERAIEEKRLKEKEKEEKNVVEQLLISTRRQRRNARIAFGTVCILGILGIFQFWTLSNKNKELTSSHEKNADNVYEKNADNAILMAEFEETKSILKSTTNDFLQMRHGVLESSLFMFQNQNKKTKLNNSVEIAKIYLQSVGNGLDSCTTVEKLQHQLDSLNLKIKRQ